MSISLAGPIHRWSEFMEEGKHNSKAIGCSSGSIGAQITITVCSSGEVELELTTRLTKWLNKIERSGCAW